MKRSALVVLFVLGCQGGPKVEVADSGATTEDSGSGADTQDSEADDTGEASDDSGEATDDSATDDSATDDTGEAQASPHRCYILREMGAAGVGVVDFDPYTGSHQTVAEFSLPGGGYLNSISLGKVGDVLITNANSRVMSFDLATGESALLRESGEQPTSDGQTFALYYHQVYSIVSLFSGAEEVARDTPNMVLEGPVQARTLAFAGGLIYAAWHVASEIDVHSAETLERLSTIPLEDYDTWVQGISVVGDTLFLADNGSSEHFDDNQRRIYRYDLNTGEQLGVVSSGFYPEGMWCEARE